MAEHIMLQFDWEKVNGAAVMAVLGRNGMCRSDDTQTWQEVAILMEDAAVRLSVNDDTDEIWVRLGPAPSGPDWTAFALFDGVLGNGLGWSWVGVNYLGYKDSFTIAFGGPPDAEEIGNGLRPRFTFVGVASRLECYTLSPS